MHLITIFKLALAGLITLTSALPTEAVAAKSAQDLVKVLDGFISFDEDGVLRSIDGNNQVIGYYQLNPAQIATMINTMPVGSNKTAMTEAFAGIDGTKVTDKAQLLNPSAEITANGAKDVSVNERAEVKAQLEDSLIRKDTCMHEPCGAHSGCDPVCNLGCLHGPTNFYAGRYCHSSD